MVEPSRPLMHHAAPFLVALAMPLAGAAATLECGGRPSGSAAPFSADEGWRLVKDWDFTRLIRNDEALRREFATRYIYKDGSLDKLNDEWQRYRDDGNHVFTDEGMSLVARVPTGALADGTIESGMIRSRWSGQHGYFEACLRMPGARGAWPAFWLNPEDGRWPPEIDVVEVVNNGRDTPRRSFHFLHLGDRSHPTPTYTLLNGKYYEGAGDLSQGFHTFAVWWTDSRVTHYVDGVKIQESPFSWRHGDLTPAGPAHVLLNLAIGGKWPGPPQSLRDFPMRLDVRYIRVWQADESANAKGSPAVKASP